MNSGLYSIIRRYFLCLSDVCNVIDHRAGQTAYVGDHWVTWFIKHHAELFRNTAKDVTISLPNVKIQSL